MSVKKRMIAAFPFDILLLFGESENVTASGVLGAVVDLKGYGFSEFSTVMDISVADDADGDETYSVALQLSDDLAFTVPVEYAARAITRGDLGRQFFPANNQINATMYRYARLFVTVGGTTPSFTATAFLSEPVVSG